MNFKKNIVFILLLLVPTLVFSQNKKAVHKEIEESFSWIFKNPKLALQKLNKLEDVCRNDKDSLYGIVLNYKGIYYVTNDKLDLAITHFENSLNYFEQNKERWIKTKNNLGIAYKMKGDYRESAKLFQQAESEAKQLNNPSLLALVYGEFASLYSSIQSYEKSLQLLLKSISYWEKDKHADPIKIAIEQQKLGNLYFKMGQSKFAIELLEKSRLVLKDSQRKDAHALTLLSQADVYIYENEPKQAKIKLDEAYPLLLNYNNPEWNNYLFELIARNYVNQKKWQKSKTYFERALQEASTHKLKRELYTFTQFGNAAITFEQWDDLNKIMQEYKDYFLSNIAQYSIEDKKGFFDLLSNWYYKNEQYKASIDAKNQMVVYNDSLKVQYNRNAILDLQIKYETENRIKENIILRQELDLGQRKIWIITLICMLLVIIIYFILKFSRTHKLLKEKELEKVQVEKSNIEQELVQQKTIGKIRNEIIQEREQNLLEQTLTNVSLQEQIDELLQHTSMKKEDLIYTKLNTIRKKTSQWKMLLEKFQNINPDFNKKLLAVNDKLTKGDVEFCSLVRLNLSTKDIAAIFQISVESVFTKKYRLMKKLNLAKDTDLFVWLNSL
jgi:DNA-binding CsgD family transcriptional regulator